MSLFMIALDEHQVIEKERFKDQALAVNLGAWAGDKIGKI